METIHRFIGIIFVLLGVILMLMAEIVPQGQVILPGFFSNAGTSFLILGVIEIIFKSYLQKELTSSIVSLLRKAISQPFDETYLRRRELPESKDFFQSILKARSLVFLKAVSFTGAIGVGLIQTITDALNESKVSIRIFVLHPDSALIEQAANLVSLNSTKAKEDIQHLMKQINNLRKRYGERISYRFYDSIPTCAIVIVDPDTSEGYMRIEPYLFVGQSARHRVNLFLSKKRDQEYFSELYQALIDEWENSVELLS